MIQTLNVAFQRLSRSFNRNIGNTDQGKGNKILKRIVSR